MSIISNVSNQDIGKGSSKSQTPIPGQVAKRSRSYCLLWEFTLRDLRLHFAL
jgi:hypothetical protein